MDENNEYAKGPLEDAFKNNTWPALERECIRYARNIYRQKIWQGVRGGVPPGGYDAEDFVEIVVVKTLSGELGCSKKIELKAFLFKSIKWEILGLARKAENRRMRSEQSFERGARYNNIFDFLATVHSNPKALLTALEEEEIHEILMGYLDFIKEDDMLFKVAKIFILPGVIYPECFLGIVDDIDGLIMNLAGNGYINKAGEVQPTFWGLEDYTRMQLWSRFCDKKKKVYLVIRKSLRVDKPGKISRWLHVDIKEIYRIQRNMGRSILRYLRTLGFQKEDLL